MTLRRIDVAVTPSLAAPPDARSAVVVIDVLRATSTIVTALDNGAAGVVPVRDQDEAIVVMHRLGRDRTLLCGERDSRLIAGFDLDNSPASYTRAAVDGKTLVFTTTNGTRALTEAARGTAPVYCAALLNRGAVAAALHAVGAEEALLMCAGSEGAVSFEDLVCAGAIVDALRPAAGVELGDAARAALTVFGASAKQLTTAIARGTHARALAAAGFGADVAACARLDVSRCVPRYEGGVITAAAAGP